MKKHLSTVLAALVFLLGLAVMLYPTASDLWNRWRESQLLSNYDERVEGLSDDEREAMLAAARAYNERLDPSFTDAFSGEQPVASDEYWGLLDPDGTGVMGYVEIPKIDVRLPLYHGTSEEVLQRGLGHLAGTSLPVGGEGAHCVISGHRGLPTALLFTDLDQLAEGDRFAVHVLGETLAYEADQILVVDPDEVSALRPEGSGDYVTLLTCTPYGVNTQRLLERGHRVDGMGDEGFVTALDEVSRSLGLKGKIALTLLALIVALGIVRAIRGQAAGRDSHEGVHFRD
ncbi:class C sortase [uncultured Parolsenella sp.]|uniref:class C sortase n=1 Tax=uncultured Parolsenella sp. TaxID=2083008 RepID=UPI0027DE8358|nr:class C sortase [uncultured Parolsenella sp.]